MAAKTKKEKVPSLLSKRHKYGALFLTRTRRGSNARVQGDCLKEDPWRLVSFFELLLLLLLLLLLRVYSSLLLCGQLRTVLEKGLLHFRRGVSNFWEKLEVRTRGIPIRLRT